MSIYSNHAVVEINRETRAMQTSGSPAVVTPAYVAVNVPQFDSGENTRMAVAEWNSRKARLEATMNDAGEPGTSRYQARMQLESMKRAEPLQFQQWAALDAARAARGVR